MTPTGTASSHAPLAPSVAGVGRVLQLTAPGTAALATLRLEGPRAAGHVARWFDAADRLAPGRCVWGQWRERPARPPQEASPDEVLDDPLIVAGGPPAEPWYDVHLHGGRRVVARFLVQARSAGFAVFSAEGAVDLLAAGAAAAWTEVTRGDAIRLIERDVEAWLPHATTEAGVKLLLRQPAAWQALLDGRSDPSAVQRVRNDATLERLLALATVALVGATNTGKSTLANRLAGRQVSIVADLPGTTRDWVGAAVDLAGLPIRLIDTPGRRDSDDPIEQQAIALSDRPIAAADAILLLIDTTRPADVPGGFDGDPRLLRVVNKIDLAPPPTSIPASAPGAVPICATAGTGVDGLTAALHRLLGVDLRDLTRPLAWTHAQRRWLAGQFP